MSILIVGVKIPKNCDYCNADLACAAHCIMVQRLVLPSEYDVNKRHPSCPLRDVPPHGDLIDRNAAVEESKKPTILDLTDVPLFLRDLPVIISASEEVE